MNFLKTYFSPFKPIKWKWYIGKKQIGTPIFLSRKWFTDKKTGALKYKPKKIGFDFVDLGWKTKWNRYRFEWNPVWSFVFFKWQIAIIFKPKEDSHYWECWLNYIYKTDTSKNKKERIKQAREKYECIWTSYKDGKEEIICYWDLILKSKYLKK